MSMCQVPDADFLDRTPERYQWSPLIAALLCFGAGAAMVAVRAIVGRDLVIEMPWPLTTRIELYWLFVLAAALLVYRLVRRVNSAVRRERVALARANRTHTLLRRISGAVLRIQGEHELLSEVCQAAFEDGGYSASWVGLLDDESGKLRPAAARGCDESALPSDPLEESAILRRAIRSGKALITPNLSRESAAQEWKHIPGCPGAKAYALFPLRIRETVVGVLVLCSRESDVFDRNEVRILEEVALATAVGLAYVRAERELQQRAFYDRVTGYAKRSLFIDHLQLFMNRASARQRVVAVLLFEVTNYRTLVDAFGWQAGDEAMRSLGSYLGSRIRGGDVIGNVGNNRLAVGLVDVACDMDTVPVLRKIIADLKLRVRADERFVPVSVAASVAVYPRDGETADELLRNAEGALREGARHPDLPEVLCDRGADRHHARRKDLEARLEMQDELSGAIARSELELVYQPIVELPSGRVIGAESLLRWNSRRFGKVSPGTFIPVAESGSLQEHIDQWVIRAVLEQAVALKQTEAVDRSPWRCLDFTANVSAEQLLANDFPVRVEQVMQDCGLTPERNQVGLEITERVLLGDFSRAVEVLSALRDLGFTIYLDDFGTGYSSLSYLHRLPVEVVKIDRSFLVHLECDEKRRSLVDAIVRMSHGLGLRVVAEGIESREALRTITEMGCDMAQGFAIAKPDSLDRLPASLVPACRGARTPPGQSPLQDDRETTGRSVEAGSSELQSQSVKTGHNE